MKKNVMMRAASALLVATLLSTCTISGTYAKYVTSDSASDTTRVAKWGVVVEASGSLFADTYIKETNTPGADGAELATLSVVSNEELKDNVVAPGTKNTQGITFAITGKPEVAVKIDVDVTDSKATPSEHAEDIFLKAKTGLPDMTTGNATDKFDNEVDYYPIKYTLTQTKGSATATLVNAGTLEAVEIALEGLTATYVDANTDLAGTNGIGTLNLTWEWDFDDNGDGTYDKQDTLLGDLAAETTLKPATTLTKGTDYNLNTDVKITISVTQVD